VAYLKYCTAFAWNDRGTNIAMLSLFGPPEFLQLSFLLAGMQQTVATAAMFWNHALQYACPS
jgi:hypothetical protein